MANHKQLHFTFWEICKMKRILSAVAATATLALSSVSAFAVEVPVGPVAGPIPDAVTGNSGLIFWAFDATRNVSIVDYLGLRLADVLPSTSDMNAPGKVLDFGTVANYTSVFGASTNSNIFWGVGAADGLGGITSTSIVSTGPVGITDLFMNAQGLTNSALKINDLIGAVNTACGTTVPCTANDPNQGQYAGSSLWGDNFGGALGWTATANPGSALGFYLVTPASGPRPTGAVVTPYQASANVYGQWTLSTAGQLVYSVAGVGGPQVPLPAGVWLLISGLTGLVTISRRKGAGSTALAA
jgi:hypothetical protein